MKVGSSTADWGNLLAVARAATGVSRIILHDGWKHRNAPLSQVGRDIKLPEDEASERLIRDFLVEKSGLPVLGEERGWSGSDGKTDLYWVIDPLDGSYNYYKGIPLYAVSVALCRGRSPMLGAIRDPARDEIFSGGPGLGMFYNNDLIPTPSPGRDMLATGFPVRADVTQTVSRLAVSTESFRKIRMIGSAALSLAWLAMGRFDGYEEDGIMWWDVAAGLALAVASGCVVDVAGDGNGPLRVTARRLS